MSSKFPGPTLAASKEPGTARDEALWWLSAIASITETATSASAILGYENKDIECCYFGEVASCAPLAGKMLSSSLWANVNPSHGVMANHVFVFRMYHKFGGLSRCTILL
jgi:hypothetical protein